MSRESSVALLVSVIAVLISLASAWFTRQQAKATAVLAANDSKRRQEEEEASRRQAIEIAELRTEEQRARLDVFAERGPSHYKLRVKNVGRHTARKVAAVFLDSVDALPRPEDFQSPRTFGDLTPGASSAVPIVDVRGSHNYRIQLSWRDGEGDKTEDKDVIV